MKNKSDWDNCSRCGEEIIELGRRITKEEIYVCDKCAEEHYRKVIDELEIFRRTKDFLNMLELRKRWLWISEQMGNWMDNADKSYMESVTDYDDWSLPMLQLAIIEHQIFLIDKIVQDVNGFTDTKKEKQNPNLMKLREELYEVSEELGKKVFLN